MASFGAPRGKRPGDATTAMPLHRLVAATPPIASRRPNPKGASALRTMAALRRGPDAKGICSRLRGRSHFGAAKARDALGAPPGSHEGCVPSAAGSPARRRDAVDAVPSSSRGNAAGDPAPPEPGGRADIAAADGVASRARCSRHRIASRVWSATASPARAAPSAPRRGSDPRPQAAGAPPQLFPTRDTSRRPGSQWIERSARRSERTAPPTSASRIPLTASTAVTDVRAATAPATTFPSGIAPRNASM